MNNRQLPEVEIRDQFNNSTFEIHAKSNASNPILPLTLTAHQINLKSHWLNEINQFVDNPIAAHEHHIDDLRIDATQVNPENEHIEFRLPKRKASYESDGIRPSEVAKDHFLTSTEREQYAKQLAEEKEILQAQQQSFIQRKTQIAVNNQQHQQLQEKEQHETQKFEQKRIAQEAKKEQSEASTESRSTVKEEIVVKSKKDEEKHSKLVRSAAIEKFEELQIDDKEIKQQHEKKISFVEEVKVKESQASSGERIIASAKVEEIQQEKKEEKRIDARTEQRKQVIKSDKTQVTEGKTESNSASSQITALIAPTASAIESNIRNEKSPKRELAQVQQLTIDKTLELHSNCTLDTNTRMAESQQQSKEIVPRDGGDDNSPKTASQNTKSNQTTSSTPAHRYQTVSVYNFNQNDGNGSGGGSDGLPPDFSNQNFFLVPRHLITYETSIEFHFRRIPFPQPPPPPRFLKKLLVHTESLERKTRAFLTGNFEMGTTDSSLRTARQKMRSLKSTLLNTDDEVRHATDTVTKAQSGDFLKIFAPPIIEKPLYEFIEIPSERSEEECSEYSDRRSERSISEAHENMEDYYSSRYSSRSSRRRVEGKKKSYRN